jgi:multidrug efflux pump subunit AcrA (membrane-fusion protein)
MKYLNNHYLRPVLLIALIAASYFGYKYYTSSAASSVTYKTALAEKGFFINSISASGTITSGDTTYITTGSTGTVNRIYVKNGDQVKKDQKLAEIVLDDDGKLAQITAWNNYQSALVNAKNALTSKQTAEITMLQKKQAVVDAETAQRDSISGGWNPDTKEPYTQNELDIVEIEYPQAQKTYDAAIKSFQVADSNIALANAKVSSTYRNYQKVSGTIFSPADGILNNFTLATGVVLSGSSTSTITVSTGTDSTTNSSSVTAQRIGAVKNPNGQYQATVNLTEVDVTRVQSGQKVTLALDAFADKTLTGTVLAVNTSGAVSSGVTSYSATILIDKTELNIYTNMAVSAQIIISSQDNVLLIPSSAIKTNNGISSVQTLKNGTPSSIIVTLGESNDLQTIITSGLSEGDSVITSSTSSTTKTTTTTTSPFTSTRGLGGPGF